MVSSMRTCSPRSRPPKVVVVRIPRRMLCNGARDHPVGAVSRLGNGDRGDRRGASLRIPGASARVVSPLLFISGRGMPIRSLVKTAVRKDVVAGLTVGALLVACLVGLAVAVAPMLGMSWPGPPTEAAPQA